MTCVHLRHLFDYCEKNEVKIGGSDLIRIVCQQCGEQEVCPSMMSDEYDARHDEEAPAKRTDEA